MTQPASLGIPVIFVPGAPGQVTYVDWVTATHGTSPFQTARSNPGVLVDASGGIVSVVFYVPNGGDIMIVRDYLGFAGTSAITLLTDGTSGARIEDPSHPTTYNLTTSSISTNGGSGAWKYNALSNLWVLWAWH